MANITELLEALNTRGAAVPTADLASGLKASREGTLKQLNREKDKGTVEGNSQEGWLITDAGRRALGKGDIHPSMIDEEVTMGRGVRGYWPPHRHKRRQDCLGHRYRLERGL